MSSTLNSITEAPADFGDGISFESTVECICDDCVKDPYIISIVTMGLVLIVVSCMGIFYYYQYNKLRRTGHNLTEVISKNKQVSPKGVHLNEFTINRQDGDHHFVGKSIMTNEYETKSE